MGGRAQPIERYIPPSPPTAEDDIFGEAVSKGENFGKYHRTQVQCTPAGNSLFYSIKIIISYFCKTKLNQLNYTKKRILVHKFYPIFVVLILKNQHLFNVIQYLVYDNKMILWHVLKLDLVKP